MTKLVILVCNLGKLPWYFEYFKHSCKYNPTVDFVVVSDDATYRGSLPANVRLVYKSSSEVQVLIGEKLEMSVNIDNPYKLCDFKPAYGVIFKEFIEGYEFWGHGDLDVIFGDIRGFITEELLSNNDLICVRHDFLTGYFLLFRNSEKMNYLYTKSKDYRKVFQSHRHYCFDETNFQFQGFSENRPLEEINSEVESMMHVVSRLMEKKYLRAHFDFMVVEGLPGKLHWKEGKFYFKNRFEILLYHLILLKREFKPNRPITNIPSEFVISPTRIYHKKKRSDGVTKV